MIAVLGRFRLVNVVWGLCAAALLVAVGCLVAGVPIGVDSTVYRAGALAVAHGVPLYGPLPADPRGLPFTYPPAAAVLFLPLASLPPQLVWGLFAVASILAIGLLVRTTVAHAAPRFAPYTGALVLGAVAVEPVWSTISFGQINLVLAALVVADVVLLRGSRGCGVLVGIAAAVKLTPLVFVLHLLLTGRRADALRAAGTFAAANVLTLLVLPAATIRFWSGQLLVGDDATTNAWIGNQSLNGIAHHFLGAASWVFGVVVAAALLAGIAVAVLLRRMRERPFAALVVTALYGTAISPIAWTHHWVWVLPALIVAAHSSPHRRAVALLAAFFAAHVVFWLPGPVAAIAYPAGALALVALLAGVRAGERKRGGGGEGARAGGGHQVEDGGVQVPGHVDGAVEQPLGL